MMKIRWIASIYLGALACAAIASCTRPTSPAGVHPAGTTTSGLQEIRSGDMAKQPMDGSTTAVAPATVNMDSGGTASGTTAAPRSPATGNKLVVPPHP